MRGLLLTLGLALASAGFAATAGDSKSYDATQVRGSFLMRAVGARPAGMGEAFTAVADDASAIQWNPGGLASVRRYDVVAMYDLIGLGVDQNYAALALPIGQGTAALSLNILNYGTFDLRDSNGVKTGTQAASDVATSLGWGFRADDALGIHGFSALNGASLSIVNEAVGGSMIGLNLGSLLPMGRYFNLGWAMQNISLSRDTYQLPSTAKIGVAGIIPGHLKAALDVAYPIIDKNASVSVGTEYKPFSALALRAGYKWQAVDQGITGLSGLGAGLGIGLGGLTFDYAYQPYGDLLTSHRVSLSYLFGSPASAAPRTAAQAAVPAQPVPQAVAAQPRPVQTPMAQPVAPAPVAQDPMARGAALEKEGKLVEAMAAYNEAIQANGQDAGAWRALGNLYFKAGKKAYAIQCFEQVQKLKPEAAFNTWLQQYKAR